MIFGQDRNELRKMYADAWQKHCDKRPLIPLEAWDYILACASKYRQTGRQALQQYSRH